MHTIKASRRIQLFAGLKAFYRQPNNQPSKLVSVNSGSMIAMGKLLNGRYQIVQVLGAGEFNQTYLAKDIYRPSNPTCVVKHFKPASNHPRFLQTAQHLFQTEAEIVYKLGCHNQIPQLLAYFEEEQNFYLVREHIEGQLLSAEMPPGYCWSESQVIQLLQEVLELLVFIHSHGLIHCNIKPDNLIRRQQDNKLVLIDFGTIKQIRTQTVTHRGHRSATIPIGTQRYIPPKQRQGNPCPNSDLYALGIIGIQALTGLAPTQFQQDPDTSELCWQQQAKVSFELTSFISKLVSYHLKNRYQLATEALEALQPLTKIQFSNPPRYSYQVAAGTPSLLSASEHKSESFSQGQDPSILLSQVPSSEPSETAVFSINPSEDSKNRSWIWAGIGTGLASAVALSAGISFLPDSKVATQQPNSNPQSSPQKKESSQTTIKKNHSTSESSPRPRNEPKFVKEYSLPKKPPQTTNTKPPSAGTSQLTANRANSAPENFSALPAGTPLIAATANPPAQKHKLTNANSPAQKPKAIDTITKLSAQKREQTKLSTQNLEAIATIAKLSVQKDKLTKASEALRAELLEVMAIKAKISAKNSELTKNTKDVYAEQPEVMATPVMMPTQELGVVTTPAKNLPTQEEPESLAQWEEELPAQELSELPPPTENLPKQEEPESFPEREVLLAKLQARLVPSATMPVQEEPESLAQWEEELPAQEVAVLLTPATMPIQEEPEPLPEQEEELPAQELSELPPPTENLPKQEEPESFPEREVLLAKLQARLVPSATMPVQEEPESLAQWEEDLLPAQELAELPPPTTMPMQEEPESLADNAQLDNTVDSHSNNAYSPVVSPDGQFLIGISANNTIKIWNMHTGELLNTIRDHSSNFRSVAISSDSQTLISVSADNTIKKWNMHTGELLATLTDYT